MLWRFILITFLFSYAGFSSAKESDAEALPQFKPSLDSIAQSAEQIANQYHHMGWFSGSVLIAKDGKVFFEQSYGFANQEKALKNSANTKFNLGSIMKNFTKVLVLQQIEKKALSLNDTLSQFNLGFPEQIAQKVTIEHLLNHRSGFDDIFIAEYRENQLAFDTLEKKLQLLINSPLLFEPGTKRRYSNYGYIVLGVILEKVTKQTFEQLLTTHIFKPIGLDNTSFDVTPSDKNQSIRYTYLYDGSTKKVGVTEHPSPDGGIESTAQDVQKFYRALFYSDKLLPPDDTIVRKSFRMDGERWGSYGGGLGVSSAAEINLTDGIEIIVLANTDYIVAERISGRIYSFIKTGRYNDVKPLATNFAYKLYKENGKDAFYQAFKEEYAKNGYKRFIGRTINELGMQLLDSKAWSEAFDIFNYLVFAFPDAPQAYDSLSYAYHRKGELAKAKETFKKALVLNAEFNSDYISNNYGNK